MSVHGKYTLIFFEFTHCRVVCKRAFRVFAQRRDEGAGDYVIPHTAITYVLDPAGRFIDHWPDSLDEDTLVMRLGTLLNG